MPNAHPSEAPGTSFDWFLTPDYLLPIMKELTGELGTSARVLMLGCGNSGLSEAVRRGAHAEGSERDGYWKKLAAEA